MSEIREECGVFGIYENNKCDVAHLTYYGLFALQHRGQESCGIVVNDDGAFTTYKDTGIVNDVFTASRLEKLGQGNMAIGHVRYGTTGTTERSNAQPIVVNHIKGKMALAHNGNLINSFELRSELELKGSIFHTTSDTEVISYIITEERLRSDSIEEAVCRAMDRLKGAYSLVIMSSQKLIAASFLISCCSSGLINKAFFTVSIFVGAFFAEVPAITALSFISKPSSIMKLIPFSLATIWAL